MKHSLLNLGMAALLLLYPTINLSQSSQGDVPVHSGKYSSSTVMAYLPCPTLALTSTITNLTYCNGVQNTVAGATLSASNGNPGYFYTYFNNVSQSVNQTSCALPGYGSTFSAAQTRGVWFTCPVNTVLTGVRVPADVGTANQFVYIVKLAAIPPEFTGSTTAYTVLGKYLDIPGTAVIDCGIPLNTGDIIGILGVRGSTSTANAASSYATPTGTFLTTIGGVTTTLARFIFQSNIATTPLGAVSSASNGAIGRVEMFFGSSISNNASVSNLNIGNYSAYYTDADGCMNTTTFAITPPATLTAVTSVTNAVCGLNGLASVNPGAGFVPYTYSWSPAGGTAATTASNTAAGTYSVLIKDASGNCITRTVTLQDNVVIPSLTLSPNPANLCIGNVLSLTASGTATNYSWNGVSGGATFTDAPVANTNYTVIAGIGSCTSSAVLPVTVYQLPAITATSSKTLSCAGSTVMLSGGGGVSYVWSTSQAGASVVVTSSGNTTYTLTGTDGNGCTNTAVVAQSVIPSPTVTALSNLLVSCQGNTLTFVAAGALTYTWSVDAQNTAAITVTVAPGITYSVTGSDNNGCTSTATVPVTVHALPSLTAFSNLPASCAGEPVTLTASGAVSYTWNTAQNTPSITVSPGSTTTYTVSGESAEGCAKTVTVVQNVVSCVGLNEPSARTTSFSVYPNPGKGQFMIESPAPANIEVSGILGEVVFKGEVHTGTNTFDISQHSAGVYYLRILIDKHAQVIKLIKN